MRRLRYLGCRAQSGSGRADGKREALVGLPLGAGDATPALVAEKLYVSARQGDDEVTLCLSAADGSQLWQDKYAAQEVTGAGRGTKAVKIEKQGDGFVAKELWSNSELAPQYNTSVLADGLLFGLSNRGNLYCINAETGQTVWTDETSRDRGGFGAIVHAGSVLLALPSSSELIAFAPSGKQFTELARIQVSDRSTYAHPVVAGKRIFVRDEDAVTMWTIE